ncbi:PilT/PilU family type 4a pilus ATPase [Jeongeupia naejangsanensis]|uniref:PilT/PilU family type 4a pilus ATPase n=1 Tax=Jeongeupia naejangsanensis TaxID=613195 RepID=A0ABS2BGD0_9NEIS|nr:PilT/PilU family type 4a pilus ATPase [Jeongeupia naejangsanensis]MBM3114520.1 PilT/PilU family type 4a pilus ATPase [Jeongeupia naejangsanensis]
MNLLPFFKLMAERQASDLFLSADSPIVIKINGQCNPANNQVLGAEHVKHLVYQLMSTEQIARFEQDWELNFRLTLPQLGNFRINVFRTRGAVAMVARYIRQQAQSIDALGLPPVLRDLIMEKRGIILVVGATGSGKSSTVSAMLEHRNTNYPGHILTIEDPIEQLYTHKRSLVNQREIGVDTHSYSEALKNAMREAPDVLMIGEIRDRETMNYALQYAQAGHLCISTLHANNSYHSLSRVVNFFPQDAREALLYDLSTALTAIVSQRLVRNRDGQLTPAIEIMLNTNRIAELIRNGQLTDIKEAMEQTLAEGSQTFEQSLYSLYRSGQVELDEALRNADSATNLSWMVNNSQTAQEQEAARNIASIGKQPESSTDFDIKLH